MGEGGSTGQTMRQEIDREIAAGHAPEARALLASLWAAESTSVTAGFVVSRFERLREKLPLVPCRLFILRSFTVEPIVPLVRALAFLGGIDLKVELGGFNVFEPEILDPSSALHTFTPDVFLIAARTRDVAPELWSGFADLSASDVEGAVAQIADRFGGLLRSFRERSASRVIIHSLETPDAPALGVFDAQAELGQMEAIRSVNARISSVCRSLRNLYVFDVDAMLARRGRNAFWDERKWLTARMPFAAGELVHVAREWMRFLHPMTGRVAKAIVCDLDNTLWGGVLGEDGLSGLKLGSEHPGAAFRELQRVLLDLSRRGVILAIASKNNRDEALEAIATHPGMLLRVEQFAAVQIHWNDKAESLRAIAAELNIGVDALAFLDDNPVERRWVQSRLPEVTVIDLPTDPMGYARALRGSPVFERLEIVVEDRERGRYYAEQRMRSELQATATSLEDFYQSLAQKVTIADVTDETLGRVAQLTQKTNQFNTTTRRYAEEDVARLRDAAGHRVLSVRVEDRFGDNGLVGVAILRPEGADAMEIDSLLLSCRVIGRTVEAAVLSFLAAEARSAGKARLVGVFLPTKKNAPASDVFARHGFAEIHRDSERAAWALDLERQDIAWPEWIERG